jgi:3-deoxy-manno-octulosonate cytidylyltransferase (CMP-KDO synthetase)
VTRRRAARRDDCARSRTRLGPYLRGARHADPQGSAGIVVNVQGDFPMLDPPTSAWRSAAADPAVDIATLALEITEEAERTDPNAVKAICSPVAPGRFRALYFTRATAPSGDGPLYHHIGLYAYRRAALARFVALPPSPLEQRERLEQLRALEAGMRIDVALTATRSSGSTRGASGKGARLLGR